MELLDNSSSEFTTELVLPPVSTRIDSGHFETLLPILHNRLVGIPANAKDRIPANANDNRLENTKNGLLAGILMNALASYLKSFL